MTRRFPFLLALQLAVIVCGFRWYIWAMGLGHESARQKACFANQHVLLGAMEQFNLDAGASSSKILEWRGEVASLCALLEGTGHLKSAFNRPGACRLFLTGNIDKGGFIYCSIHGWRDESVTSSLGEGQGSGFHAGAVPIEPIPAVPEYIGDERFVAPGGSWVLMVLGVTLLLKFTPYSSWWLRLQAVLSYGSLLLTERLVAFLMLFPWGLSGLASVILLVLWWRNPGFSLPFPPESCPGMPDQSKDGETDRSPTG